MTIRYRWHPLCGRRIRVEKVHSRFLFCALDDGTLCALPPWMMDAAACARHSTGSAETTVAALAELAALLTTRLGGERDLEC